MEVEKSLRQNCHPGEQKLGLDDVIRGTKLKMREKKEIKNAKFQ